MASELERLLLTFEADTRKLREALSNAESGVEKFEKKADRSLGGAERRFQAFENRVTGTLKGIGAALAAQFTGQAILGQIGDVAALEKVAKVAGVTAEKMQELRAAARAAGVESSEFDGVMTKFAVTMGEFRSRTGDFYQFIRNQIPALEAQLLATKSQSEAFDVVADAVSRLRTAEERALFTKKALGESSVLLVGALEKGPDGFKRSAAAAREYGQVVSEDAVKATAELKKELDALGATITGTFQEKLGKAAPWLTDFTKGLREAWAKGFDPRTVFAEAVIKAQTPEAMKPAQTLGEMFGKNAAFFAAKGFQANLKDALKIAPIIPDWKTEGADSQAADALEALRRRHAEVVGNTLENMSESYQRDVDAFTLALQQKKITEAEYQEARQLLNSVAATKITEAYDKETAHVREQLENVKATIDSTLMRGLEDALRSGKVNFRELIQDMSIQLTKLAIQAQIVKPILDSLFRPGTGVGNFFGGGGNQAGEIMGSLGSIFGGFRAAGGPVSAGKPYIVGEKRPELFVPNTSGRILPSTNVGGGGSVHIDARNSDIGVEQRLRAMFMEMQRSVSSPVDMMARAQKRFPLRRAA